MGTTANLGLPYPDPTDPVNDVDLHIKAAVEAIDAIAASLGNVSGQHAKASFPLVSMASSTSLTEMDFTVLDFGSAGHVLSAGRLVVPAAGTYRVSAFGSWSASGTATRGLQVSVSGTLQGDVQSRGGAATSGPTVMTCTQLVQLLANDELALHTMQNSGGNLNVLGGLTVQRVT